jgi:glycosyltransferase involved in cell wall biosynthesis
VNGLSIRPWAVLAENHRRRWGGDLRRHYLFLELSRRTRARAVDGWDARQVRQGLVRPRRHLWTRPARVASAEFLWKEALDLVVGRGIPAVLDFHDDPVLQAEALGLVGDVIETSVRRVLRDTNVAAFRWLTAPSAAFAAYAGLDMSRVIVAPNGSDTAVVREGPWPLKPVVGLVSGAAPARGIETLIEAVRLVRSEVPHARLLLWLAATGAAGQHYLDALQTAVAGDEWIEIGSAPYDQMGAQLARASVLVLPTPAHPYWDSVAPVKLFDCMAAGRPIVTSPRTEPARIVEQARAGIVSRGDRPGDLAEEIARLLGDASTSRSLGANGRSFVVAEHDWTTISARVANALLDRRRYHPLFGITRRR